MHKAMRGFVAWLAITLVLGIGGAALGQSASVGKGILTAVDLETGLLTLQRGDQVLVDSRTEIVDGEGERMRLEQVPVSTPDETREIVVRWESVRASSPPLAARLEVLDRRAD